MKKKKMIRVASLVLALLLAVTLLATLTGCGGNKVATINSSWTAADTDAVTYFSRIVPMSPEAREMFVAASRGYNMAAEGFDKNADAPDLGTVNFDGAYAALDKVKPTDDASVVKFEEFKAALTAENVREIVTRMGETVSLEAENGPIDTILVWIGKFLQILTKITGGKYVFGLLIFAIVIEVLMLPFGIKQQNNSIKQAKMRPKEMAIRNKYKGRTDQATQQKMAQEIQKMYQDEGFNPMGGCLPMLIQLPIILALYQIVIDPLRYVLGKAASLSTALTTYCTTAKAAGGLGLSIGNGKGTIELLSQAGGKIEGLKSFSYFTNADACYNALTENVTIPDFNLFGINMGAIPTFTSILVLVPILTFVFYFLSMKLNRKFSYQPAVQDPQMGCSNNMMDITMPLMSVYIAFIVPAAVGIYWIFKSILGTLKQFIMSKAMPMPVFTEEDYKEAERALKGKKSSRPAVERPEGAPRKVRSLHYIDEDDEPLPPPVRDRVEEPKEKKQEEPKEQKEQKKLDVPNLKEDRKQNDNKK